MLDDQQPIPPRQLPMIQEATKIHGFGMASEALTGALLRSLAASKPGGNLLELGTGTGLATAWLLAGMDVAAKLTDTEIEAVANYVSGLH